MVLAAARVGLRRNAPAVAPAFVPTQLAGCAAWLDAAQITGATDGANVATWQDLSGGARHVAQATAAKQPIYRSTGALITPTGRPVVQFDGVDDFLTYAGAVTAQPYTAALVVSTSKASGQQVFLDKGISSNNSATYIDGTSQMWALYDGGAYSSGIAKTAALVQITAFHKDVSSQMYVNGVAGGVGNAGTNGLTDGYSLSVNAASSGDYVQGAFAEVIVYNRILTNAERLQVEAYLKTKHGTP